MKEPEKGFYHHYKHDPKGSVNDYAYEVLNMAHHTEMKGEENALVIYRPLYEAFVYKQGKHWDARPMAMFMEKIIKDGKEIERFTLITDPKIISELEKIRDMMYK